MNVHPEKDRPWNFYFNGEVMPKWGACWSMTPVVKLFSSIFEDERHHFWRIYPKIDHIGCESDEPAAFVYVVQEVLLILLKHRRAVFNEFRRRSFGPPEEIYNGLVATAFQMRESTLERGYAFWTSGYEANRQELKERMRRAQLPPDAADFKLPPHRIEFEHLLKGAAKLQVSQLKQLTTLRSMDDQTRKQLYGLRKI